MVTTREILLDYIRYRLYEKGYSGGKLERIRDIFAGLPLGESPGMDELHCVSKRMECNIYHAAFLDMVEQQFDITSDCAKSNYTKVLSEIFEDRIINWGRLMLVMIYTGRLAVRAAKAGCQEQIRNLVEWCETFFHNHFLDQWIEANGGWDRVKELNKEDWQEREVMKEMGSLSLGLVLVTGVVAIAYYILSKKS